MASAAAALGAWAVAFTAVAPAAAANDVQSQEWYLDAMKAEDMWKVSTGKGITVAVIDSGVAETPSLQGRLLPGENFSSKKGDVNDDYSGHGTSMAELIAGSGRDGGVKGLAPDAKILPYRITTVGGSEDGGKLEDDSQKGIRAAADSDARIISMSFGGPYPYPDTEQAIKYASKKGKLLFASTGNEGSKDLRYPSGYPGVVGISAIDEEGTVAKFSQHGVSVDLAAPGVAIPSWCDATLKKYCTQQGTSQAAAIASASAALIWSAHPDWTANQVLRVMIDTAGRDWPKDTPSNYLGYGLIRPARNLLHHEGNPGPADVDPITGQKTPGVPAATSPSTQASQTPDGKSTQGKSGGETSEAASDTADSGGGGQTWIIIGAVAAVVVIGGAAFAFTRIRRAR